MTRYNPLSLFAALAIFMTASFVSGAPVDLMKEARELNAAGDAAGAVVLFHKVAEDADADVKMRILAYNQVASLYANTLGEIEKALATYDTLIAMDGISANDGLAARNSKASLLMRIRTRARAIEMRTIWADIGRDENLTPAQRIKGWIAVANNAAQSSVYANLDEARDALEQAFAIPDLTDAERAEIETQKILFFLKIKDFSAAADSAQRIIDAAGSTVAQKLNAFYQLAGVRLSEGDEVAADKTVRLGQALPDLTEAEQAVALFNIGQLNARMYQHKAAREAFIEAAKLDPRQAGKAETALAATLIADGDFDAAYKLHFDAGRTALAASVRQAQDDTDAALKTCRDEFENPDILERLRWLALSQYIDICNAENRFEDAQAVLGQYEALVLGGPNIRSFMNILRNAMTRTVYGFAAEAADVLCRRDSLVGDDRFFARLYRVNALAGLGDIAAATAAAKTFAQDKQLSPDRRLYFALTQGLLAGRDRADVATRTIATVEKVFAGDHLSSAERQDALLRAGRTAMIANHFESARVVGLHYDSLFVPEPTKTYTVPFMPKAPASIDGFLASDFVANPARRGVFDRKFGGNLELVVATDASTGDRGDVSLTEGATGDTDTAFLAVCDADGIHVFYDAKDDRTPEVEAGLLRGGSFEGYIAAGERAPHTCFLVNLQTGKVTLWNSAYATEQHTPIEENSATFRSEFRHTQDSHLLYLFFDWELFHDKLPSSSDDFWLFETARWARGGRVTWNGLKTVHGRSSFGNWRFNLSDADQRAIKRKLIYKAYAKYTGEKNPRTGGFIDFYADKDYSDPVFYETEVAPLIERLDAYGKRVSADMSDAEVDAIFAEAVPLWMNIRYRISDLRRVYLKNKLITVK